MAATNDVLLQTPDIATCASFYERILGLSRFLDEPSIIGLDAGPLRLFIDRGPSYGPVLEFVVPDFDFAKHRLVNEGCFIDQEKRDTPRCYVRDQFGLIFNIRERP